MKLPLSVLLGLLPAYILASDVFSVAFASKNASHLYAVIGSNSELDYGCRPAVMRFDDEHKLHAIISTEQYESLKQSLDLKVVRIDMLENLNKRQTSTAPIGQGDRFQGGKIAPRGLGVRKATESFDVGGILNTYEGQSIYEAAVSKAEKVKGEKQYIYLIYFISDLLYANEHRIGLTYGNTKCTNSQVKKVLGTGIVFIPLLNPDGVKYDQANGNRWRKNRNPASAIAGNTASVGVDLNRNFDFLWNYTRHFDPSVSPASNNPASSAVYGTAPFSEPESRNMKTGTLLYSWGDDINQSQDKSQNLFNPKYDGKRGVVEDSLYKVYTDEEDWYNVALQANRTTETMMAVGGRQYIPQQAVGLYLTSGASDDYSFSRWHKNKKVNKVYGYTMEFGYPANFYPTVAEFVQNIIDTNAGFMGFCLTADDIGLKG